MHGAASEGIKTDTDDQGNSEGAIYTPGHIAEPSISTMKDFFGGLFVLV
jgi:hypothetical protein